MMAWYDDELARFTVPYEARYLGDTHVLTAGDGPPVLLLHGLNINAAVWRPQFEALAGHTRLIAPDVPGFAGKSAPTRLPYTGRALADWLLALLDALGIDRALVVGSSAGGHFALKLAAYAPQRVQALLLLNPVGIVPFRGITNLLRWQPMAALTQAVARVLFTTPETCRWLVERAMAHPASPENITLTHILIHDYQRRHGPGPLPTHELRRVTMPVHLLLSEHEIYTSPARIQARAARVFPRLTIERVARCGHDINKEQPEIVHRHIHALLRQPDPAR